MLVVDDNVDAAGTLAMLLEGHGHEVRVVHDAREVEAEVRPHAAILDIGLPHIDGYQLVLIALTGYGQPEDVERARLAGFDHHLVKPVDPDAVPALVRAHALRMRGA